MVKLASVSSMWMGWGSPSPGDYLQDLAKKVAATPAAIVQRTAAALRPK
jgi:hypothetical protein